MISSKLPLLICATGLAWAATPELSRPVRPWEFMDAVGPRAAMLGTESGTFEAWVFPLKLLRDFRLVFTLDGRAMPAESLARRAIARPGSFSLVYSGDDFQVTETFVVPVDQPGVLIRLSIQSAEPLRIDAHFTRDFQLMWPAAIGAPYIDWQESMHGFILGADGQHYRGLVASPDAARIHQEYGTNYSASTDSSFTLGTVRGRAERVIAIAGSFQSDTELAGTYRALTADPAQTIAATEKYYEDYLDRTVQVTLPDADLQQAYDWSRLSELKALVRNPFLGEGLAAGFGLSRGGNRPGFAWFFGRDSFWTSLALTAAGDFATARAALRFIAHYQRADGKVPHEISQSASLVPWFENYPYPYASADATPLFVVAVRDYVETSGDREFLKENWERLNKAMSFMRSTLDADGFPRNDGVGHGWVEGGPLLPVRTEFYQAGLYVEALHSMILLARLSGDPELAGRFRQEFQSKKQSLNQLFWLSGSKSWAFALGRDGRPVDQPSVLATVPMWFDLADQDHSREMIRQLADDPHATDWGMRIISARSSVYNPAGYHYGSVWPLFTGWASVGEYRNHAAEAGYANLKRNSWLALDGAGGNTTEVLSGDVYSPLSTASSHQTWSAAMVVSPLLVGLFRLQADAVDQRISIRPHLPANWVRFASRNVPLGEDKMDFTFQRDDREATLHISNHRGTPFQLVFSPAFAPVTELAGSTYNGAAVNCTREESGPDWHARCAVTAVPGESALTLRYRNSFGYTLAVPPPRLGESNSAAKLVSEDWEGTHRVQLTISGKPGTGARIDLFGVVPVTEVEGAQLAADRHSMTFTIPGSGSDAVHHTIRLHLERWPMWQQNYTPLNGSLALSALVAAIPVFVLLYLLGVRRKPAWKASLAALMAAVIMAAVLYRMPAGKLAAAVFYGAAFGLFPIGWVVFSAILLYRVTLESGKFEILKDSVGHLTEDRRLQALLIAFAFGAFIEGAAGFGTPVAVAGAMLAGLGFSPYYAAGICLLANTAPVAFGSIGIPIVTLAGITGLPIDRLSAGVGRICAPVSLIVPAYLIAVMGGWKALRGVLPAAALCGIVFGGTQFLISNFVGAQLTDILASLAAMGSLVALFKVWKPRDSFALEGHETPRNLPPRHSGRDLLAAWGPYGLLVVFVLLWGYKPIQAHLNSVNLTVEWPWLHNTIERMPPAVGRPAPYAAVYNFNWLSASGTACLFAALLSALWVGMRPREFARVFAHTVRQLFLAEVTLATVLALAFLMNYCGATATLGLAFAATGALFPFFSALLGWLGVFLTGSDTSANALFGNLQVVTAHKLAINPVLMAASNSSGGVMGKMISLTSIAVASAATNMRPEDESRLFRFTLRHSVFLATLIGLIVTFYAYVAPGLAP